MEAWKGSKIAALTAIFAKVGIKGVNSDLATAIRTVVILVLAWAIVFFKKAPLAFSNSQKPIGPF